jgi:hypothetical protein
MSMTGEIPDTEGMDAPGFWGFTDCHSCSDPDTNMTCANNANSIWNWAQKFKNVKAILGGHSCIGPNNCAGPNEAFSTLTATDGHTVLGIYSNHQRDYTPNSPGNPSYSPSYSQVVLLLHLLSCSQAVVRVFNTTTGKEITQSYYYPNGLPTDVQNFPVGANPSVFFPYVFANWIIP